MSLLRADYHPDGVIRGRTNLDKGFYTVFITGESVPPVRYQYLLRVQQINYARVARSSMGAIDCAITTYFTWVQAREIESMQNWLASRRS